MSVFVLELVEELTYQSRSRGQQYQEHRHHSIVVFQMSRDRFVGSSPGGERNSLAWPLRWPRG